MQTKGEGAFSIGLVQAEVGHWLLCLWPRKDGHRNRSYGFRRLVLGRSRAEQMRPRMLTLPCKSTFYLPQRVFTS